MLWTTWICRRAKYLLDGARHVMDNLGGKFPETAVGLMGIPGVCVCVVGFVCACVRACVYVHA